MTIDERGNLINLGSSGHSFTPALPYTLYEIDGALASAESVGSDGVSLATDTARATLNWKSDGAVRFWVTDVAASREGSGASDGSNTSAGRAPAHGAGEEAPDTGPNAAGPETIGLVLPVGLDSEFHLPEYRSTGRIIDSEMPLGESYEGRSNYNFLLVHYGNTWMRVMIGVAKLGLLRFAISRHPAAFVLTVTWPIDAELVVEFFDTLEAADENFRAYIKKRFGVLPLVERENAPAWPGDVPLVLTVDMLRSNGEIVHDFNDVSGLARDLAALGCPANTLFYLPGWNGDYDAGYPFYEPHPDLGGEKGFLEMMKIVHDCGYRVVVHTNPQGIDPYDPRFDQVASMRRLTDDGQPTGWQIEAGVMPPSAPLKFRTGRNDLPLTETNGVRSFETVDVLDHCEAVLEIGGVVSGAGGTRVTIGRRSQVIPAGAERKEGYRFPYAFDLAPGRNRVIIKSLGDDGVGETGAPKKIWYRILECYTFPDPYAPWTFPIQNGDTENPVWIDYFVSEVVRAVEAYGIDAVHLDAATHDRPHDNSRLFAALAKQLPGTAICGEWSSTIQDIGYWSICQGAVKSLNANTENVRRARDCNSTPIRSGIDELFAWLDKPSPVCSFARDYFLSYLHLCAADAFVPVGKVCNILPARKMPPDSRELHKTLANARRYGTLVNLRVNYREYGLDEETRDAIRRYVIED